MDADANDKINPSIVFDQLTSVISDWLQSNSNAMHAFLGDPDNWLLFNRDLYGRVRLILPDHCREAEAAEVLHSSVATLMKSLGKHASPSPDAILYEESSDLAMHGAVCYPFQGFSRVWLGDRLATESSWTSIKPEADKACRIAFFSIKGGVGRSTALAATAWHLAQVGKRVLVLDLDLESPGLSTALLASERQPRFGITDWLVEDLVGNSAGLLENMIATSDLSHDGEIYVVPAHGADHGEYIAKLSRVWMPVVDADGRREAWPVRLQRLLDQLESRIEPDAVLLDCRSGIDEIASAGITALGANLILLFALAGEQTWTGYRMLFEQWHRAEVLQKIRDRLRMVGALIPELDRVDYVASLREDAYTVFLETLYEEISPAEGSLAPRWESEVWRVHTLMEGWNFDEADEGAPHYPWQVNWHRSFAGLRSLQGRLARIDGKDVQSIFGSLVTGVADVVDARKWP